MNKSKTLSLFTIHEGIKQNVIDRQIEQSNPNEYQDYIDNVEQDINLLLRKGSTSSANVLEAHLSKFKKERGIQ